MPPPLPPPSLPPAPPPPPPPRPAQFSFVRTYKGSQSKATLAFQADAQRQAAAGYFPANQTWAPGSYGCGAFVLAALLAVVVIGLIAFIYMLIVKPPGVLTVTYQRAPGTY